MKSVCYFFFSIILFLLSGIVEVQAQSALPSHELIIQDSISIDYLGDLTLLSVHPDGNKLLFYSRINNEVILTDGQGKIIKIFKTPNDSLESVGTLVSAGTFFKDKIILLGQVKLGIYDQNLVYQDAIKIKYPSQGIVISGMHHLQPAKVNNKDLILSFSGYPQTHYAPNDPRFYNEYNTFDLLDLTSKTLTPIIPLHPKSRYKNGEAFYFIRPIYQVENNKVWFVFNTDINFYSADLNSPSSSFKSIKIPFDKFLLKPGHEMNQKPDYGKNKDMEGTILDYFRMDSKHILFYKSGLEEYKQPDLFRDREQVENQLDRLNPTKWIMVDESGKSMEPKLASNKYNPQLVDSKGILWAVQNINILEEEPDQVTFYKLKLVQK